MCTYVIKMVDDESYWSNEFGWSDLETCDIFTEEEKTNLNLPLHGEWSLFEEEDDNSNEEIEQAFSKLEDAFYEFSNIVKEKDSHLYEQWKSGGFIVSDNVVSMYPNAGEVCNRLIK